MNRAYHPIEDYGVIGNLRSVALICRDSGIDWCCFPDMDRPSVFAAILDARRGGRFRLGPPGFPKGDQAYLGDSNVLQTRFSCPGSRVTVTDFMPLAGGLLQAGGPRSPDAIIRLVVCGEESSELALEWSPRFNYARAPVTMERLSGGWIARSAGVWRMSLGGVAEEAEVRDHGFGPVLTARLRLRPGERRAFICRWDSEDVSADVSLAEEAMQRTVASWEQWAHAEGTVHHHAWAGTRLPMVIRSELVLKLLSHADTGAIAAAATTSLPETMGGIRNWDYRYTWLRDSALVAQALTSLGHDFEGRSLLHWLERVAADHFREEGQLRIMYSLHGQTELIEEELGHLEGYRGSRPVRIGNGAAAQFQLETYGEVLNTAYELLRRGEALEAPILQFLSGVADYVGRVWQTPDQGIWEFRGEPRQFVYSKILAWVAMDRAIQMAERYSLPGDPHHWRGIRSQIRRQVEAEGFHPVKQAFTMDYRSQDLDAANLRIPMLEFLPAKDHRFQATLNRTLAELTENGLVFRYRADDGLPGKEGAFGLCSFWLVDALALSGRRQEAADNFDQVCRHANHLGLFPEQFDPATGGFLGNFPQAFTHLGLINSAIYLAHAEGRRLPEHAPLGTMEHREISGDFRAPFSSE